MEPRLSTMRTDLTPINTSTETNGTMSTDDANDAFEACLTAWSNGFRPLLKQLVSILYASDGTIADSVVVYDIDGLFETVDDCVAYVNDVCSIHAWGEIPMTQADISFNSTTSDGQSAWCDAIESVHVTCDAIYSMQSTTTPVIDVNATVVAECSADGIVSIPEQPTIVVTEQQ